jgi:cell fate regulator YaaT (PSP1 superfamily)
VDEDAVRKAAIELVRELKLDMKISDTEWQWDRRRLTCYFTAEERVDFRQLVRQLERRFSTRVHMWHIGVRDEARRLDGVGRCGRQFCSSSWLPELRPVKSSSAKDQRLSTLNPSQISGTCGRLMCCLRHEHEFYVQARKRFPKEGKIITTGLGEEKIVANDIFRDQVTLRSPSGETRTIPLAQLRKELGEGALPVDEPPDEPPEDARMRATATSPGSCPSGGARIARHGRATRPARRSHRRPPTPRRRTSASAAVAADADAAAVAADAVGTAATAAAGAPATSRRRPPPPPDRRAPRDAPLLPHHRHRLRQRRPAPRARPREDRRGRHLPLPPPARATTSGS